MKSVLIVGSGRSAPSLIRFLGDQLNKHKLVIADKDVKLAQNYTQGLSNCQVIEFDIENQEQRDQLVRQSDLVLSMVPVTLHQFVLDSCIKEKVDMITPSYETSEMLERKEDIDQSGILVLSEMGLDPGIDHMSAMKVIDELHSEDSVLTAFESFTGGLIAPGYDQNPWQYKFTWNPRNVVLAGQGGAIRFLHNGRYKYIPYTKVFRRTENIEVEGYGTFEGYANRDSLDYLKKYGLENLSTIFRGTLRRPGFCRAWDLFIQLGVTDDSYIVEDSESMTYRQFINSFLPYNPTDSVELKLMQYLKIDQDSGLLEKLRYLDVFSDKVIGLKKATPAKILEHILSQKWLMEQEDKDMIVMWHKFYYKDKADRYYQRTSSLVALGEDAQHTAMARTVGLPMGIAVKLILNNELKLKGMQIPVNKMIYEPVLSELEKLGIAFNEKTELKDDNYENQPVF